MESDYVFEDFCLVLGYPIKVDKTKTIIKVLFTYYIIEKSTTKSCVTDGKTQVNAYHTNKDIMD